MTVPSRSQRHLSPISQAEFTRRLELCDQALKSGITLNGVPARIGGARRPFATVTQVDTGLGAEWSWEAVERIVTSTGRFCSTK
jgi:hypothetical protein